MRLRGQRKREKYGRWYKVWNRVGMFVELILLK